MQRTIAVLNAPGASDVAVEVQGRKVRPIKGWAAIGAFFVALQLYVYAAWITSDHFKQTPVGDTPPPGC